MRTKALFPCIVALVVFGVHAIAQSSSVEKVREFMPYHVDSGHHDNLLTDPAVVFTNVITLDDVIWMRLHFAAFNLPAGSAIRMTSLHDGSSQTLDADGIARWNLTSAYFNGNAVLLELIAAPGSVDNWIVHSMVEAYFLPSGKEGPCYDDNCGIIGSDERVLSSEIWAARTMPGMCTASVYNTENCVVTAGHCCDGTEVLQFDVPLSAGNCTVIHPLAADQFPITGRDCFPVPDYGVMTVGTNDLGETPYERYGVFCPISSDTVRAGDVIEIFGYGSNNNNPPWNLAQQYSSGHVNFVYGGSFDHIADITAGVSGSAILRNGEIIGVQSGCDQGGGPNVATRIDFYGFVAALENMCPTWSPAIWAAAPAFMMQIHPNPFNPVTEIRFSLPKTASVDLRVYDLAGRLIRTLADERAFTAGAHSLTWNGRGDDGALVGAGVYLCRLQSGADLATGKMLLLK